MMKDTPEGTTHYFNDGCGEPAHNCGCNEMSCKVGCKRNHTHKTFSCHICNPKENLVEGTSLVKENTQNKEENSKSTDLSPSCNVRNHKDCDSDICSCECHQDTMGEFTLKFHQDQLHKIGHGGQQKHDCMDTLEDAVRIGRANYQCKVCKKDVSMAWFYLQMAIRNLTLE